MRQKEGRKVVIPNVWVFIPLRCFTAVRKEAERIYFSETLQPLTGA